MEKMPRPVHPNKHIEAAVAYALDRGWRYIEPGKSAHVWGKLDCSEESREGHKIGVYSTPKNPENHAKSIRRLVDHCTHRENSDED